MMKWQMQAAGFWKYTDTVGQDLGGLDLDELALMGKRDEMK